MGNKLDSNSRSCIQFVFLHDQDGRFLSFHWQTPGQPEIVSKQIIGSQVGEIFGPVDPTPYLEHIRQVLQSRTPQPLKSEFYLGKQKFLLDLMISPVEQPGGPPEHVVVTGQTHQAATPPAHSSHRDTEILATEIAPTVHISADRHHKLLAQITGSIRRTLDLPTIWRQTVEGLGSLLGVSRCIVSPYEVNQATVTVVEEYCRGAHCPMKGLEFVVADDPDLSSAITKLTPINVRNGPGHVLLNPHGASTNQPLTMRSLLVHSMLIMATSYQDQPNGLLVLYQDDRPRRWTEIELEFLQELADQVGTAIAHANLIADSQSLAAELKKANSNLLQKHRELEEARQQAEEASRLKSEFLANTSHEVRTPLNGVLGFLKLILDGTVDDPEEQFEFIQDAHQSALHLLSVLDDILDIAKLEAGCLQIEMNPVKLADILHEVEAYALGLVRPKHLSFEIQKLPTDDEIILYGNYQRIVQVMLNLLGNAIKFTHEGGVTVSFEIIKKKVVVQDKELPGMIKVRVADTGIGVSLDKQDRLFQSFSQVDGSRTRRYGGTGLGLAISQSLVEAMGGVVNFYSMGEGLGSTVTFTVPLYQEPVMITSQTGDPLDLMLFVAEPGDRDSSPKPPELRLS
jgi:signal transduction histidine kinase